MQHAWGDENLYNILVGKPEGKRLLGRYRRKWEDNIKTNLTETRCKGVDWIKLAQDRFQWLALVNSTTNFHVP
jgi:hypothetical protein